MSRWRVAWGLWIALLVGCENAQPAQPPPAAPPAVTTTATATASAPPAASDAAAAPPPSASSTAGSPLLQPMPDGRSTPDPKAMLASGQAASPLALEIARMLGSAARHATRSGVCYDGSGWVVAIDEVALDGAPHATAGQTSVGVRYRVSRVAEHDTRGCGADPDCASPKPIVAAEQMTVDFARAGKRLRMRVPAEVPGVLGGKAGLPGATPLSRDHDTACYGHEPPFVPEPISP